MPSSKVLLVADRRAAVAVPGSPPIRRYRLARLRVDGRAPGVARFDHLKRTYD
jgi:hypothetical protein